MRRKGFWIGILVALLVALAVRTFGFCLVTVSADSADSLLVRGDRVLVQRWSYGLRVPFSKYFGYRRLQPHRAFRDDWLAFNVPDTVPTLRPDTTPLRVARCMALPGDTVWVGVHGRISRHCNYAYGQIWPVVVPSVGAFIHIHPWNAQLYARTINAHEDGKAFVRGDSLYVNGRRVVYFRFQHDYYWLTSGDDTNLNDSRTLGFIPEFCLLGRLSLVLYSFDGYRPRWNRILKGGL